MAKFEHEGVAVAMLTQGSGQGTFNPNLDAITTSISGDVEGTDEGLLLGDPNTGIGGSGLTLTLGRRSTQQRIVTPSRTRPISLREITEVSSFQFAWQFGGNREITTASPIDADFTQLLAQDAILNGFGMVVDLVTPAQGIRYLPGSAAPLYFSTVIWVNNVRIDLQDCLPTSLSIDFTPGKPPIATVDVAVGVVKEPADTTETVTLMPTTLNYGSQLTVVPAIVESVNHTWDTVRGFSSANITITQDTERTPDGNADDGVVIEPGSLETKFTATLYADDSGTSEAFATGQLGASVEGDLLPMSFQVGTTNPGSVPALAVFYSMPLPVLDSLTPTVIGNKAAWDVSCTASGSTINSEFFMDFL